ncbi:hypothetical protein ZWY2020_042722 [Hordeum vulgare]|nr:hypothetical protein ZWY2020_042722 [Hordeum vulgare]
MRLGDDLLREESSSTSTTPPCQSSRPPAAAIRGADVFFTLLPEDDKDPDPEWTIEGAAMDMSRQLPNQANGRLRSLTRALDLFAVPQDEVCGDMYVEFHMLASECRRQFRIVSVAHDVRGSQAAVFSSETREWQVFPFSEDASQPDDGLGGTNRTMVNGFVY